MADLIVIVVLWAHVLAAVLWVGSMGFSVLVLRQVIPRLGMPARREFMQQFLPAVFRFVPVTAVATIVLGTVLYLYQGNFDPVALWGGTWGLLILASLVLTLGLFVFGILVVTRSSRMLLVHLNEQPCTHGPEVGRLQGTFNRGQAIALVWGIVVLALMVVAAEV